MMRILMLVNWKVEVCEQEPADRLAADYVVPGRPYWFFRYFPEPVQVDVVDIRSFPAVERLEKERLRFYVTQFFKIWPRYKKYDLILSHGMQSGIVFSLYRRLLGKKIPPHVVFDIGSFNSAKESGKSVRFLQYASRALDGILFHASSQMAFYRKCYPWLADKAIFLPFGADTELFGRWERDTACFGSGDGLGAQQKAPEAGPAYVLYVGAGYQERDTDTLLAAWERSSSSALGVRLRMIGSCESALDPERVELVGKMPIGDLNRQIAGALFCVLPLTDRNFSYGQMTLLQQMAFGKAVVTADARGVRDYVRPEETGLLYAPGEAGQLAKQLDRLLHDEGLRERLGRSAKEEVYGYYNERRMAADICSALKRLGVFKEGRRR